MSPKGAPVVRFESIVKRFPNVLANDRISFEVEAGTIHALLGENGAGKTTLMNVLYGLYQPDGGRIYLRGEPVRIPSPQRAIRMGIGMVHQHFKLVPPHTVAENIALGLASARLLFPTREVERKVEDFSERYGLRVDPRARIWQLSAGEQQRVEILKALYRGADILVLDEPTSVLTPGETEDLFSVLEAMTAEGHTVIFITHKLDEVMRVSDRVTVLRKGRAIATLPTSETDKGALAEKMVGRQVIFRLEKKRVERGEKVLEVEGLCALNDMGVPAIKDVSFAVHEGEILGVAGVAGNGQRELVQVLTGLRAARRGRVIIAGREATVLSPRQIARLGVAHIPEDRHIGLVDGMSVADNLILKHYGFPPFSRGIFLDRGEVARHARRMIAQYNIIAPGPQTPARVLSGGNRQRLMLARELSGRPRLIIAAHPTYGLDVGATEQVRTLLLREQERGAAILLISEDLDEVMDLSDRIMVMFAGEVMGTVTREEARREELGLMMAGEAKT